MFKIGDKVKVVKGGCGCSSNEIGRIVTITAINGQYVDEYNAVKTDKLKNYGFNDWISASSFVLVKTSETEPKCYGIVGWCKEMYK
jgi:hypothetical protein